MLDEVGVWLSRIVALLPQLVGLWEASKGNENQQLEASLRLVRAMKDRQAAEEIGSP